MTGSPFFSNALTEKLQFLFIIPRQSAKLGSRHSG